MGGGAGKYEVHEEPHPDPGRARRSCITAKAEVGAEYEGQTLLSAHVGSTQSRLHLFIPSNGAEGNQANRMIPSEQVILAKMYENRRFESFVDIIKAFLKEARLPRPPQYACLALPGAVFDRACTLSNKGWTINAFQIEEELGIKRVQLINDFVAMGYGCLTLDKETEVDTLWPAAPLDGAPIVCIGAGTGLGESFMTCGLNGDYEVWPSEGGHAEFAPRTEGSNKLVYEMVQYLQIKYSYRTRISVERIVSTNGLANIYEFLTWKFPDQVNKAVHKRFLGGFGNKTFDPTVISQAAMAGECGLCKQALDILLSAFGAEAGVMALTYMPFGGVYVCGGLTYNMRDAIVQKQEHQGANVNHFLESFFDKGRVAEMLTRVPIFVVKEESVGERGAMLKAQRLYMEHCGGRKPTYD